MTGFLLRAVTVSLTVSLLLTGCGDDKKEKVAENVPAATAPGKITVHAAAENKEETRPDFRNYDVRGQSQIKYAPEGQEVTQEVKNVQVVVAARNNPYGSILANLSAKRLSKKFIVLCSACHDDYGNGVVGPSLIGKSSQEVREMIDKYTKDPNANVLMTDVVNRMTPQEVDFIANDLARFNAEVQAEKNAAGSKK